MGKASKPTKPKSIDDVVNGGVMIIAIKQEEAEPSMG